MKRVRGVINLIQPPGEGRAVPENTEPVAGRRVIGLHRMCASFLYYPVVFQGHSLGLENSQNAEKEAARQQGATSHPAWDPASTTW